MMNSPLLGLTAEADDLSELTKDWLQTMIDLAPLVVFQFLNKKLNKKGVAITFDKLDLPEEPAIGIKSEEAVGTPSITFGEEVVSEDKPC
jgi:hypothetical protein